MWITHALANPACSLVERGSGRSSSTLSACGKREYNFELQVDSLTYPLSKDTQPGRTRPPSPLPLFLYRTTSRCRPWSRRR